MSLNVAIQMDPIQSINIAGDSSFALMLSAQARGHELFHYDVGKLTLDEDGRLRISVVLPMGPLDTQARSGEAPDPVPAAA